MSVALVLGLQWGDEGKGKIVDLIAEDYDYIVRFNGGDNAGHTVKAGDEEFKLHLIPSGVFYPDKMKVIGNGTAVNPETLISEMKIVEDKGYSMENFMLSSCANLIMPWHRIADGALDKSGEIGTTKKGIGPAYSDKAARSPAIRAGDLLLPEEELEEKVRKIAKQKTELFEALGYEKFDSEKIVHDMREYSKKLSPYIRDTQFILGRAARSIDKKVMLEGAQGSLLDIDHGTFPYVTSSNVTAGAGCTGSGISPDYITRVCGIAKAYTTRVGEGPFPTELDDENGQRLRDVGHEFGTTTGRPRRCGWLDLVLLKYTALINGTTELAITKLDVLSGMDELRVATAYDINGEKTGDFPLLPHKLKNAKPLYTSHPGWKEDISGITDYQELPKNARKYVEMIGEELDTDIKIVSVGPKREQTIRLE
jgi:adenylosuccinate synthase